MNTRIEERLSKAKETARKAGAIADGYFRQLGTLNVEQKGLHDFVTKADTEVEEFIRKAILEAFPEDAFLGEESGVWGDLESGGLWVVDPIDGTQPFVNGLAQWCVSIAYLHGNELIFGVVFNPPLDEMFVGGKQLPATLNGKQIRTSTSTDFMKGYVSIGYTIRSPRSFLMNSMEHLIALKGMFHRSGSGALSLCYVACGRLLGHVEHHINSWDCLAAIAIIRASGGITSNFLTKKSMLEGNNLVAGPPQLFGELSTFL